MKVEVVSMVNLLVRAGFIPCRASVLGVEGVALRARIAVNQRMSSELPGRSPESEASFEGRLIGGTRVLQK